MEDFSANLSVELLRKRAFDEDQDAPTFSSRILNGPRLIQTVASCYKSALRNLTVQVSEMKFSCKKPDQSSGNKCNFYFGLVCLFDK